MVGVHNIATNFADDWHRNSRQEDMRAVPGSAIPKPQLYNLKKLALSPSVLSPQFPWQDYKLTSSQNEAAQTSKEHARSCGPGHVFGGMIQVFPISNERSDTTILSKSSRWRQPYSIEFPVKDIDDILTRDRFCFKRDMITFPTTKTDATMVLLGST